MNFTTTENFILLAQHPSKGRFLINDIYLNYGLTGAILLDLSLNEIIILENKKLCLIKEYTGENKLITEISKFIQYSKKPRKLKNWIGKIANKVRKKKWLMIQQLADKGLLKVVDKKFLGIFSYKKNYLIEKNLHDNLIRDIKHAVLNQEHLTNDMLVLIGLIEACKMHKIFNTGRSETKELREKMKQIIKECPIAETIKESIMEIQAAIMVSVIAASSAATISSN